MAKRPIYYTATGKTLILTTKVDTTKYGATLLGKMGFSTTPPAGANNLIVTASFEKMVEVFGFQGVKVQLAPSGTPPRSSQRGPWGLAPGTNPNDLVGETYDAKTIEKVIMGSFEVWR